MEANQLLKQLRTERNLSQRKLAHDISERSTLATFEQKGHRIAFDTLYAYLTRMNVTLEEFEYQLHHQALSEKITLSRKMLQAYYQQDTSVLNSLIEEAKRAYEATNDFMFYILYSQYLLIIKDETPRHNTPESQAVETTIKDYLNRIDTWGKFELTTFTNLMFLFSDEYILNQIDQLSKKRFFHNTLNNQYQIYTKLLTNAAYLFIDRKNQAALAMILSYLSVDLPPDNDRIRILIRYFEGILALFEGNITDGNEMIEEVLVIWRFIGQDKLADQLTDMARSIME